jgi:hypothetical protein
MATSKEHPQRYGWWINELESLGISVKKTNELNDLSEIRSLAENIKQDFYQHNKSDKSMIMNNTDRIQRIYYLGMTSRN